MSISTERGFCGVCGATLLATVVEVKHLLNTLKIAKKTNKTIVTSTLSIQCNDYCVAVCKSCLWVVVGLFRVLVTMLDKHLARVNIIFIIAGGKIRTI